MTELKNIIQKDNITEKCKINVNENGYENNIQESTLKKRIKKKLQKEDIKEDCISKEAIPLPWAPVDPIVPSEEQPKSPVSENSNTRVVVELKWLDNEGHASTNGLGEQAACGFKASLTLAEADKVNEFIAQLKNDNVSNGDTLSKSNLKDDQEKTSLAKEKVNYSQHDTNINQNSAGSASPIKKTKAGNQKIMNNALQSETDKYDVSQNDVTKKHENFLPDLTTVSDFSTRNAVLRNSTPNRDVLPVDALGISNFSLSNTKTSTFNRQKHSNATKDTQNQHPNIPTIHTDPMYTKRKAERDTTELDRMVQSALTLARARREMSVQKIIDDSDDILLRGRRCKTRDTMSMTRATDSDSYRSRFTDYTKSSRASCEPSDISRMTPLLQQDSVPLALDEKPRNRTLLRATSMPVESRSLRALKLVEKDMMSGTKSSLKEENGDDDMEKKVDVIHSNDEEIPRASTPYKENAHTPREESSTNGKPLPLPEIKEEQDAFGSIVEEMDLLTTYHGAGVFCPLTTDDIPEPTVQAKESRRGRSVSVMRRLLSDGEGQYSRESTPMASIRRQFKVWWG